MQAVPTLVAQLQGCAVPLCHEPARYPALCPLVLRGTIYRVAYLISRQEDVSLHDLDQFGRFLEPALLILVSLAGGPKHGYAMMEDIDHMCHVRLGAGTLYGALTRLEQRGWIEALAADDRRRPYQLTDRGAQVLQQHLARVQQVTMIGLQRLGTL